MCRSLICSGGYHDDDEDVDRRKFEKFVQERIDIPLTDNGLYLTRTVLPQLTNALVEVGF